MELRSYWTASRPVNSAFSTAILLRNGFRKSSIRLRSSRPSTTSGLVCEPAWLLWLSSSVRFFTWRITSAHILAGRRSTGRFSAWLRGRIGPRTRNYVAEAIAVLGRVPFACPSAVPACSAFRCEFPDPFRRMVPQVSDRHSNPDRRSLHRLPVGGESGRAGAGRGSGGGRLRRVPDSGPQRPGSGRFRATTCSSASMAPSRSA